MTERESTCQELVRTKINVIDAESLELIKQIDVGQGPHGIRANEEGSKVYVGVTTTNEILVIDSDSLED